MPNHSFRDILIESRIDLSRLYDGINQVMNIRGGRKVTIPGKIGARENTMGITAPGSTKLSTPIIHSKYVPEYGAIFAAPGLYLGKDGWIKIDNKYITLLSTTFKTPSKVMDTISSAIRQGRIVHPILTPEDNNSYDKYAIAVDYQEAELVEHLDTSKGYEVITAHPKLSRIGYIPGASGEYLNAELRKYIPGNILSVNVVGVYGKIQYPGGKGSAHNVLLEIVVKELPEEPIDINQIAISMLII